MRKNWKKIAMIIVLLVVLILLVVSCSAGMKQGIIPHETTAITEHNTEPAETTVPTEIPSTPDETTAPTEPEETEPPTTEPPATEPPETKVPATIPPETQHIHSYSSQKKDPSCTESGYITYVCVCGYSYTEVISATGHNWSDWTVIEQPTTNKEGVESRNCKTCGEAENRAIEKIPGETEPPATEPPATEAPTEPPATEPPQTEPPVTEPPQTEPPATEPPATEPPATEPPQTEPPETEPAGCNHSWEMIYHPEEGHYGEYYIRCACGHKCFSESEWASHAKSFGELEALLNHTSWSGTRDWIVDSPEYTEWVCSKCGASTTNQPY